MAKNVFKVICKKCQGKCCKETVVLTQKDINKLNVKYKNWFRVINEETNLEEPPGHIVLKKNHACPFLGENGCILEENMKPFDCLFFPLAFVYKKGKLSFYLNKKCPYYEEIPKKWVQKTKKWAQEQLKFWTEKEKLFYSKDVENYQSSVLIPLERPVFY